MRLLMGLMLFGLLAGNALAGKDYAASGAEIKVANCLVFSCIDSVHENHNAFRFDPGVNVKDSGLYTFWFAASHAKHFIDFIDNHMLDMELEYRKSNKPQAWSVKADDGTEYVFTVEGWPDELKNVAPKRHQEALVRISSGKPYFYIPTTVLSQSWRPAFEPSEIQEYEALLANAKKWAAVAQRDLESGRALRKMSKENMEKQRQEAEQRKASPPPANPANVVPL